MEEVEEEEEEVEEEVWYVHTREVMTLPPSLFSHSPSSSEEAGLASAEL